MITTEKLSHKYPNTTSIFYPEITCNVGEKLVILGDSGVGKSTLLYLLGGLLKPTAGKVYINGNDMYSMSKKNLDVFRGNHIGMIFQQAEFMKSLNVEENLQFSCSLARKKYDSKMVQNIMDQLGIPHKRKELTMNLSVGERQRLSIARALVTRPKVILADEPTSALDDNNCRVVLELMDELSKNYETALIIVTHDQRVKMEYGNSITLNTSNSAI